MEFEDFCKKLNIVPYWIKGKKDALIYARHLAYRMYESRAIAELYQDELRKLSDQIHKDKKVTEKYEKIYVTKSEEFMQEIETKKWKIQDKFEKLYCDTRNLDCRKYDVDVDDEV